MSTRSRIGIELPDGKILSAYHHWDGYPEWLGRILKTHYSDKELVKELIRGGDMSSCWTNDTWDNSRSTGEYGPNYYSLRGEKCPPRLNENLYDYLGDGEEYAYLYKNEEWICYELHETPKIVSIPSAPLHI